MRPRLLITTLLALVIGIAAGLGVYQMERHRTFPAHPAPDNDRDPGLTP
jgi:hypothetical protein